MTRLTIVSLLLLAANAAGTSPAIATDGTSEDTERAVLVTGASSGIGLKITEYLADQGFHVYAGARKEKDLRRLAALDGVSSLRLDVTKQEEIDAAVAFIRSQGRGLFGVINNAGVGSFGRMSQIQDEAILWMHDVNVLGPHRINRAFVPLLKESGGRTAIIGSISGYLTGATSGAYSMSKFAVEAYTESLAADLRDAGVKVGVVAPGGYKSRIREKAALYRTAGTDDLDSSMNDAERAAVEAARAQNDALKEPDEVAEAVVHFLTSDNPRLRYMVTPDESSAMLTVRTAMRRALQLNSHQPYEMSRDELVATIDELLAENGGEGSD